MPMHTPHTPSKTSLPHRLAQHASAIWSQKPLRWLALATLPLVAAVSFLAVGGSTAPTDIAKVTLPSEPLFAAAANDKPTLALALSVEYPTVGAQYVWDSTTSTGSNSRDDAYTNSKEYLGYYDAESCYTYNNAPTETPASPLTTTDYKRFDRTGPALALSAPDVTQPFKTSRMCTDAFSGNFLNWASNSAIDMLRLALSGGDRYIDSPTLTVLQRAVLPNGDPICMWNSTNFPAKHLQRNGGGTGKFWGAVPVKMITDAGTNDIWVANTLNRIYFRAAGSPTGGCGNPSGYTLAGGSSTIGPITSSTSKPAATTDCVAENGTCSFTGIREVWYGAAGKWFVAPVSESTACANAVFGDPAPGVGKRCYYSDSTYTGTWVPSDGFLYSRVSVCEKDSTTGELLDSRDYKLCTRYPDGNYKPVGVIQKYSDQMRLAAFGYLLDQDRYRYGGVLRAPMKYVGAKTFTINGVDEGTPNAKGEWDVNNGVFKINPDGNAMGISGVVNYLNKFGRTGTPGMYKKHDPVSDLYYETLRYLQGLPPSAEAISGIDSNPGFKDGFPVFTDWTDSTGVGDPYGNGRSNTANYSCQKNNIVVIGDINTHDNAGKFPATSVADNIPNIDYWTGIVGAFERGSSTNYTDGQGASRTTNNPNSANGSPKSDKIVGLSYWAHTQDIRGEKWTATGANAKWRPGLRTKTFIFDVNEYGAQNNVNTRRYNNQFFTAAKYGGFESDPSNSGKKPYNTFGNPFMKENGAAIPTANNDVWQKKTEPGEASAYYLQSSARGVLSAFDDIFSRASTSARSIAGVATETKVLQEGKTSATYQGTFDTSDWSGDLKAIPIAVSNDNTNTVTVEAPLWSAAEELGNLASPETSRNIVMGRVGATATPTATNFAWTSAIDASLQTLLNKVSPTAAADGRGKDRLDYLRGKKALEGTIFRLRNTLMGDVVNSQVVYSGKPTTTIRSSTYSTFATSINSLNSGKGRTPVVFVGANDGMLHAFAAATGKELFAYIPSWMGPKLSALTEPSYVNNHQSYVDGSPVVAEALVSQSPDVWKTVLVAGTGAGGRGVFALDVTDPDAFSANKVMWEFTQADDKDMGYVVGRPQILKLRTNARNLSPAEYRWFAVVASGVNNYTDDGAGNFSDTGAPALFLMALDKAAGSAWSSTGSAPNYYKIMLPVNNTLKATMAPGLVNFSAALGTGGEVAQIYAGDLHGNLWKLDFELAVNGTVDWIMKDRLSPMNGSNPSPLYVAQDAVSPNPNRQPITMAPSLIQGDTRDSTYVAFGTGKYLEAADKNSTKTQSIYTVFDDGTAKADSTDSNRLSLITGRDRLVASVTDTTTKLVTAPAFKWGRPKTAADTTQRSGWYFDLPNFGERQISNAASVGDYLVFNSLIPGASGSANTCTASGGSNVEYIFNVDKGGTSTVPKLSNTLTGEPLVMDLEGATTYSSQDNTGRRIKTIVKQTLRNSADGLEPTSKISISVIAGRLSWRQINNYQDLK